MRRSIGAVLFVACLGMNGQSLEAPCGKEPFPPWPDVDQSPTVKVWDRVKYGANWVPPACMGWSDTGFTTLVATVARFRYTGSAEGLLQRIGAISGLAGVRYWSTTRKKWQTLIVSASALQGDKRRGDFQAAELKEGRPVYYQQEDSLTGKGVYQMRVVSSAPDRLVIDTRNVSTQRYFLVPVFHPGDVQSMYFLERESPEVWRYYDITRTGKKANGLVAGHEASSVNRAIAFYRHLVGIPTDKEPPFER